MKSDQIETIVGYIEIVKKFYNDERNIYKKSFFFRGVAKAEYKLLPSIFRTECKSKEREILLNYRDNLPRMQNKHLDFVKDRLEILVDMQHYDIPTRLLDWTMDPLIALYFAVREKNEDKCCQNSVVWVFNPWTYQKSLRPKNASNNWFNMSKLARALLSDRKFIDIKDVLKIEFYGDSSLTEDDLKYPFPLIAKYQNPRIIHQSGAFTIHGICKSSMEDIIDEKYFKKIIIPCDKRKEILEELNLLFINEYTVFPDKEGMSRQLKNKPSLYDVL